jgi:tetratricopeptide (TPR) repeat protein
VLAPKQEQTLVDRPTRSLEAYDAFLRGEAASQGMGSFDGASLRRAAGLYEQAVALDSTFAQAWARLSQVHSALYYTLTPTAQGADEARRAAERAVVLAPNRPEGHQALGYYYSEVLLDNRRALEENAIAQRLAPGNADVLVTLAAAEYGLGRWEDARGHLVEALRLDPRSSRPANQLATVLLYLRRYPEAREVLDRALTVTPTNLELRLDRAMVSLGQGSLAEARAAYAAAPKEVEPTALVAYVHYWDLYWLLHDDQQQLLLRLTPTAFENDRATWAILLAETWWLRGDHARARVYADSARLAYEEQLRATPKDGQRRVLLGLALAYLGRNADAIREGERGVPLWPIAKDAYVGPYVQHQLARIYILVGETEKALDQLEPPLKMPYYLSHGWLKIDPNFAPLRGNPRFERLVKGM